MSAYNTIYNSQLLDELHNHFPAILYEPDSFHTVSDLMNYVQLQMRLRFDLYSNAARAYRRAQGLPPQGQALPRPPAPRAAPLPPAGPPPRAPLEEVNIRMQTGGASGTLDLLGSLLGLPPAGTNRTQTVFDSTLMNLLNGIVAPLPSLPVQQPPPLEAVLVRPTLAQIDAGTTIEIVDAEEEVCAICQDAMEAGSQARSLNACDHRFHVACIDTWFQRNVRCPVCRHDVREPAEDDDSSA